MPDILTAFGLIAAVLILAALTSGIVERAPLSFPIIFLGLGLVLSEPGLGVLSVGTHDGALEVIGNLTLALVLFLDAVNLQLNEVRENWKTPALALGPGAIITMLLVAAAAAVLFDITISKALLFGAILASTDPVVLRDIVQDVRIPRSVRESLRVEAGTNDIVVLPTVLVLIAVTTSEAGGIAGWEAFFAKLLLLSPLVGASIGLGGAWLMSLADARFNIRREYQALYGIGLVLAAYTASTALGGDGFLASFAAGAAVTASSFDLCDCFMEFGEVVAEMAMLFAFIIFGAVLAPLFGTVDMFIALIFAIFVICIARPVAFAIALRQAAISNQARAFISWFGPRGLNSLLLVLLAVQAGVPNADWMMGIVGIVVMVSVVAHGTTATPVVGLYARYKARKTLAEERVSSAAAWFDEHPEAVPRITPEDLAQRIDGDAAPVVLDVRTASQYAADPIRIPGSERVAPDAIPEWIATHDRDRLVVAYCT